jgi:hypothetical protein
MPTWLKIVLALLGIGLVGGAVVIGGFVWWVSSNKEQIARDAKVARDEGKTYGESHTKEECVTHGLVKLEDCGAIGVMCEAQNKIRLGACLEVASDPGGSFCSGVAPKTEIMKSAMWANEECRRRGHAGSQPCGRFMQGVQDACRGR